MKSMNYLICLLVLSASISSQAERAGNPHDDRFAIQKLQEQNPNLTPDQVLMKAFEESEGRIPEMKFGACPIGPGKNLQAAYLFRLGMTGQAGWYAHYMQSSQHVVAGIANPSIYRYCVNSGPLLGQAVQEQLEIQIQRAMAVELVPSTTGLVFVTRNAQERQTVYELRQYNSKTVVIVTRPKSGDECTLANQFGGHTFTATAVNGICSVEYVWDISQ